MHNPSKVKRIIWMGMIAMSLTACNLNHGQGIISSPTLAPTLVLDPTPTVPTIAATSSPTTVDNAAGGSECNLGIGLRAETIEVVLRHKDQISMVMAANSSLAEEYFDQFEGVLRVIGAPSLAEMKQKAERAAANQTPYEALAYGLETGQSTPDEEWQDLIGSTEKARTLSDEFDKLLVMGPGFKLLSENEDSYGPMGALADIWILQTQQLQKGPPDSEYRREVERIISLIRAENPDIEIWAQITLPPDRPPDAEEWLAYHAEIADLVDGTYIGVYTWDTVPQEQLNAVIEKIIETVCENR